MRSLDNWQDGLRVGSLAAIYRLGGHFSAGSMLSKHDPDPHPSSAPYKACSIDRGSGVPLNFTPNTRLADALRVPVAHRVLSITRNPGPLGFIYQSPPAHNKADNRRANPQPGNPSTAHRQRLIIPANSQLFTCDPTHEIA
jgi:hypothetical protein